MGNKILRRATLWLLVLFAVFCFAPFSSSADDGYDAHFLALHEFLWDSYLKLSHIFNWNAPSDPRCEDFFAGIVLAAIERASLG